VTRRLLTCELPPLPYGEALELQRAVARARIAGRVTDDVLLLVEHPPVITLGRSSRDAHLVASPALLAARGVERFEVDRGGDVTFHGPGQLVGYPVFDLKQHRQDLHWYLRTLEQVLIEAVHPFGIAGSRNPGFTGVWVEDRKLASIGVHARDWVTWHGFALNVTTDLSWFDLIVPCGIAGVSMTSLARERTTDGEPTDQPRRLMHDVRAAVVRGFEAVFGMAAATIALEELRGAIAEGEAAAAGTMRASTDNGANSATSA
jgi:lipoate-protein ligase B